MYYMLLLQTHDRLKRMLPLLGLAAILCIVICYNVLWLTRTYSYAPFFEPDNYMYYKYAMQVVAGVPQVNTQLVGYGTLPFFEHPGLYLLPAELSLLLHANLVYVFYSLILILIALDMFLIYKLIHSFYEMMLLPPHLEYFAVALAFLFPLLLYQFEPIEWRGNLFLTTIALCMAWTFFKQFTLKGWARLPYLVGAVVLIPISWYMWSGWYAVTPAFFALMLVFTYMPDALTTRRRVLVLCGALGVILLALFVFNADAVVLFSDLVSYLHLGGTSCLVNPLHISEVECLTPANGLTLVVSSLLVFLFGIVTVWKHCVDKRRLNFYIYLFLAVGIAWLPIAMLYVRAVTMLAPFLSVGFGVGYSAIQYKSGDSLAGKLIQSAIMITVIGGLLYFMYAFYIQSYIQYQIDNPAFLPGAAHVLDMQNGTVNLLTFYAYGDWFEAYTHVNVYADTVQGGNPAIVEAINTFLLANSSSACGLVANSFSVEPNYILVSKMFKGYVPLMNASNSSVLEDPTILTKCGFRDIYTSQNTTIWSREAR